VDYPQRIVELGVTEELGLEAFPLFGNIREPGIAFFCPRLEFVQATREFLAGAVLEANYKEAGGQYRDTGSGNVTPEEGNSESPRRARTAGRKNDRYPLLTKLTDGFLNFRGSRQTAFPLRLLILINKRYLSSEKTISGQKKRKKSPSSKTLLFRRVGISSPYRGASRYRKY
jgi:hypothetical protein